MSGTHILGTPSIKAYADVVGVDFNGDADDTAMITIYSYGTGVIVAIRMIMVDDYDE